MRVDLKRCIWIFEFERGKLLAGVNDSGIVKVVHLSNKDWNNLIETTRSELLQFRPYVPNTLWDIKFIPVIYNNKKPLFHSAEGMYIVQFLFKQGIEGELYEDGLHKVYVRKDGGVQGPLRPLDIKNLVTAIISELQIVVQK